jgi:prefoldin subunit 5
MNNTKRIPYTATAVDKMLAHVGPGKFILTWATGQPVIVHISKQVRRVHVLENESNRTIESIKRKLKQLTGV